MPFRFLQWQSLRVRALAASTTFPSTKFPSKSSTARSIATFRRPGSGDTVAVSPEPGRRNVAMDLAVELLDGNFVEGNVVLAAKARTRRLCHWRNRKGIYEC